MTAPVAVNALPAHGSHARRLIAIDTEMSLLDLRQAEPICLSAVEMLAPDKYGAVFHTMLKPEEPLLPTVEELLGVSNIVLAQAPNFASISEKFLNFIDGARLVCMNKKVDRSIINGALARIELPPLAEHLFIDVLQLAPEGILQQGIDGIHKLADIEAPPMVDTPLHAMNIAKIYWKFTNFDDGFDSE